MGQGTPDVGAGTNPRELEEQVEQIRENVTDVVRELDRRRQDLFDWRLQINRHKTTLAMSALAVLLIAGGAIGLSILRKRRRSGVVHKSRQLREAFGRIIAHPEHVARPHPTVGNKVLSAAATTATSVAIKAAAQRILAEPTR